MTVQAENVSFTTISQVQLKNHLPLLSVDIDEDDHLISEIAQDIFTTHYDKLFEIKNARSIELSDLIKQKHSLERTWIPYLAKGSYANCFPRYFEICAIQLVASSCLGMGLIISGSPKIGLGITDIAIAFTTLEAITIFLPCVSNVLQSHDRVLSNISIISNQQQEIIQLIKFTNVFAKFCSEWPQLIQKFEKKNQLKSFKLFSDITKEYDADIMKIIGEEFLQLAPLFLMEKVCILSSTDELATSWKQIKDSPKLWEDNDLWKNVQWKNPAGIDYINFFKTLDTHIKADPSRWSEWFSKKLEIYIEKSKTLESI